MRLAQSKVHFIGIGGIGMSGLAELLHNLGAEVTGSDPAENALTLRMEKMGIPIFKEQISENVHGVDVVVYSSAVKPSNPEYAEALSQKIPLIRRAEALAELMRLKRGIAVAGTHGKTTTTSLVSSILWERGMDPTIVVGGRLEWIQSTAQLGKGEWLVAEADESDGSFNRLSPEVVVITNIDSDHLDHYGDFRNLQNAFMEFASRIPFYGSVILCGDDKETADLFSSFGKRILTYGFSDFNTYQLQKSEVKGTWKVRGPEKESFEFNSPMPGDHNALNALAAILSAHQSGLSLEECARSVSQFEGVDRRFQHKATIRGVDFYDDYGHHPTEVQAVLKGFKDEFPNRRLITFFQPHRFSRTQICWKEFLKSFGDADVLYLLNIYPAGEDPIEGVSSSRLMSEMNHQCVKIFDRSEEMKSQAINDFEEGDVVLTLGAGDVYKLNIELAQSFLKREKS
ncbi:UDP-N-acetylmuramate--L-alanine ligase [bacterium]|nr:UDP-N-acetylmuramate--L-alanine ligase [bacterium]